MYFNTPVKLPRPNDSPPISFGIGAFFTAIESSVGNLLFLEAGGI